MDINTERKIAVNGLIIKARWFYAVGVLIIGILTKILSKSNIYFSLSSMLSFFIFIIFINIFFYLTILLVKRNQAYNRLNSIAYFQIIIELVIFILITHLAGGIESMSLVFFFLPIVAASLLFGLKGSVVTAILSGLLINILIIFEYYGIIPHISRYGVDTFEFKDLSISLTKTLTISLFYVIVGIFSGFGSRMLFTREKLLEEKTKKLKEQKKYRENELKQLDKTTKLLVKRDLELTTINKELDKKIKDIKRSEKSMFKAFDDLKEAREKSEKESHKIAAIIANFIDPIIVIDKENKLSLLNPAAKDIFGLIDSDLGKEISSDNNYSMNNFKKMVKKDFQVKTSEELKPHNPNEEEVVINYSGQDLTYKVITEKVLDNKNEYLGTMKVFYNLTREKIIDKLKSEFISIAAHQLRTPLSAIKWVIKMVLDGDSGPLNKDQQQLLFKGYQSNERIINLVNDMLNVSRIEEGRFGYSFSDCDFREVLNIVIDSLDNLIKGKNIKFFLNIPKKMPKVHLDRQKMTLVLQNLLENAIKYTPEYGKIEITVEFSKKFLKFKIKDNGVGIPEKDQGKLFSKFFRADNVVRMQTEGSGLGLFIVKNVIKRHGGDLTFQSEEGKGTEFVFTLPIK